MGVRDDIAVVTGAAGGIGRAIVDRLLADGARVAAVGRSHNRSREWGDAMSARHGDRFSYSAVDVSDETAVAALGAELEARGPVSYLVSNAAVQYRGTVGELETRRWDLVLRVNLLGAFLLARAFVPGMASRGFGRIVAVSSVDAVLPEPAQPAYIASKGGLEALMRAIAMDHIRDGITANSVSPGLVVHDNLRRIASDERLAALAAGVPMGRAGTPTEIAAAIAYLLDDDAGYTTGQVLHVNGGMYLA
jgi:NAD(P)-dependent dehydrogenase (short-subunit alcohol dehydrogenase family)